MQKVLFQQRYGLGRPGALGSTLAVAGATGGTSGAGGGAGAGATSAAGATYRSSAGCCLRWISHELFSQSDPLSKCPSLPWCPLSLKVPLPPMVPTLPQSAPPSHVVPTLPQSAPPFSQKNPKKNNCQLLARGTLVDQAQCIPMWNPGTLPHATSTATDRSYPHWCHQWRT